jgi:hypothetical protein
MTTPATSALAVVALPELVYTNILFKFDQHTCTNKLFGDYEALFREFKTARPLTPTNLQDLTNS